MSRIGSKPIAIPAGVEATLQDGTARFKGPLGALEWRLPTDVTVEREADVLVVRPTQPGRQGRAMWGLARAHLANMAHGVKEGFEKNLEIHGVGARARVEGKTRVVMSLGFSHDVICDLPEGVEALAATPTQLSLRGIDKQKVGQAAATLRAWRPPEPYKGKGVRYVGEHVERKEGKKK